MPDGIIFRGNVTGPGGFAMEVHEATTASGTVTVTARAWSNPSFAVAHLIEAGDTDSTVACTISGRSVTATISGAIAKKVHIFVFGLAPPRISGRLLQGVVKGMGGFCIEAEEITLSSGAGSFQTTMGRPVVSVAHYNTGQTAAAAEAFSTKVVDSTRTVTVDSSNGSSTKEVAVITIGHG